MKYRRIVSIVGPLAVALSLGAARPAYADRWCSSYDDPTCVQVCGYGYPYPCEPYPDGDLFFGDPRRFHHCFDHDGYDHRGFHHGGFDHGGVSHGGFGDEMFSRGRGGGHGR